MITRQDRGESFVWGCVVVAAALGVATAAAEAVKAYYQAKEAKAEATTTIVVQAEPGTGEE